MASTPRSRPVGLNCTPRSRLVVGLKARLLIAKLDRLSRDPAFIAGLMDSGVEFVACDNLHATRLTLHILAAVAEHEREMISARTKAALQAAKARGAPDEPCAYHFKRIAAKFEARIKELVENVADLAALVEPLLVVGRFSARIQSPTNSCCNVRLAGHIETGLVVTRRAYNANWSIRSKASHPNE